MEGCGMKSQEESNMSASIILMLKEKVQKEKT
jgi:hypothetical protein